MGLWCDAAPGLAVFNSQAALAGDYGKVISVLTWALYGILFFGCTEETIHDKLGYTTVYSNPGGMTSWMPVQELIPQLMVGDLLEFEPAETNGQTHWAIYKKGSKGQSQVVHLWKASDSFEVRIDDIYFVAEGRRVRRNNKYDKAFTPQSTEKIMGCASKLMGYSNYHLLRSNCEHFAVFCRNGQSVSAQANKAKVDWSAVPIAGNIALHAVALFHKASVSAG